MQGGKGAKQVREMRQTKTVPEWQPTKQVQAMQDKTDAKVVPYRQYISTGKVLPATLSRSKQSQMPLPRQQHSIFCDWKTIPNRIDAHLHGKESTAKLGSDKHRGD
jgi:hypothetical protein